MSLIKHDYDEFEIFTDFLTNLSTTARIGIFLETIAAVRSIGSASFQMCLQSLLTGPRLRSNIMLYLPMTNDQLQNLIVGGTFYTGYFSFPTRDPGVLTDGAFGGDCCILAVSLTPGNYSILPLDAISPRGGKEIMIPPGTFRVQDKEMVKFGDLERQIYYVTFLPDTEGYLHQYLIRSHSDLENEIYNIFTNYVKENIYKRALEGVSIKSICSLRELTRLETLTDEICDIDDEVVKIIDSNLAQ